jgi:hypothetical protein
VAIVRNGAGASDAFPLDLKGQPMPAVSNAARLDREESPPSSERPAPALELKAGPAERSRGAEMDKKDHSAALARIASMLAADLKTISEPFPQTDKEFAEIVREIRRLDPGDVEGKLVAAGFLNHPYGRDQMRCRECNYYLIRRKWCDLPEIALPVEPDWWCRLWRI